MKKLFLSFIVFFFFYQSANAQVCEFQIVTVIESIVPNGLGRSRMITSSETRDFNEYSSSRSENGDKRNKSKREDIRLKNFEETKLLNFFNIGGIRFQNIAANDAVVTSKLNDMSMQGWELSFVSSGVESYGGKGDGNGIYVTRYLFKRLKTE